MPHTVLIVEDDVAILDAVMRVLEALDLTP